MVEVFIGSVLLAGACYAILGLAAGIPLQRRILAELDPDVRETGPLFRALITPGALILWPLCLARWRSRRQIPRPHPAVETRNRRSLSCWRGVLTAASATILPGALVAALVLREPPIQHAAAPYPIQRPPVHFIQRGPGPVLGRLFPSMPAIFQRARNQQKKPGLFLGVEEGATLPPTSIYWSPVLDDSQPIPDGAVHVDDIWGTHTRWLEFKVPDMWDTGYWIAYSHAHKRAEVFATRGSRKPAAQ